MGLLDVLNGMANGPHGQTKPLAPGQSSGMSPLTMALLGLLAYKALNSGALGNILGGAPKPTTAPPTPASPTPSTSPGGLGDILGGLLRGSPGSPAAPTGSLGDILGNMLGGKTAAGPALNNGLRSLLTDLEESGQGDVVKSWVGTDANKAIAPGDLAKALGADTISALSSQTGMSRDQLLSELSRNLPQLVDQLTPDGRLPTQQEAAHW